MIVEQFGLRYTRVNESDLELVRYWRNQDYIRSTMQFKDYITPKMQRSWFNKMNNKFNYYFIIHHNKKKIGLINCKDSSPDSKIAEGGIFVWDKAYWATPIPAYAALTMLHAVFEVFKSGVASIATVDCSNKKAIDFNLQLGYRIVGKTDDQKCFKLSLTSEDYFKKTQKFKRAAELLSGGLGQFKLTGQENDLQTDEINNYLVSQQQN